MNPQQRYSRGVFAIIAASVIWGTTGTAAFFAPDISALAIGAFAMGVGGILLVLNALGELTRDRALLLAQRRNMLIGGLSVALYPLVFYSSMRLSGVAIGTVVSIASAPLFTVVLECLVSRRRISPRWGFSFVVGASGIVLLALGQHPDSVVTTPLQSYLGIGLGLVAGLSYATYSWMARHMIEQGVDSKSAMASMFGLAAMMLLPTLIITGHNLFATVIHTGVVLYMALVPMFAGYLCFAYGLRYVAASTATLITLLEPVVAVLLAVLVVGEWLSFTGWLGIPLIMLSLLLQTVRLPMRRQGRGWGGFR